MIATSSGGGVPVAQVGASNVASKPADGETIRNPLPLISANLSAVGAIDPGTCHHAGERARRGPGVVRSQNQHGFVSSDAEVAR